MKTFKDLEFKNNNSVISNKEYLNILNLLINKDTNSSRSYLRASMEFDNGYGISCVCGYGTYTSSEKPFECAVLFNGDLCFNTHITNDVIGYCDEEKVTLIMKQIQEL